MKMKAQIKLDVGWIESLLTSKHRVWNDEGSLSLRCKSGALLTILFREDRWKVPELFVDFIRELVRFGELVIVAFKGVEIVLATSICAAFPRSTHQIIPIFEDTFMRFGFTFEYISFIVLFSDDDKIRPTNKLIRSWYLQLISQLSSDPIFWRRRLERFIILLTKSTKSNSTG